MRLELPTEFQARQAARLSDSTELVEVSPKSSPSYHLPWHIRCCGRRRVPRLRQAIQTQGRLGRCSDFELPESWYDQAY